jgi:peroxiredoxin
LKERETILGECRNQPRIVKPGDPAQNFSLKDQNDTTFDLYENREKRTRLSFHPLAWRQLSVQGRGNRLKITGMSFQNSIPLQLVSALTPLPGKKAWAENPGITRTPLLCDFWPYGMVAQHYGLFREQTDFRNSQNVLIDEKQDIVFVKVYPVHSVPDTVIREG